MQVIASLFLAQILCDTFLQTQTSPSLLNSKRGKRLGLSVAVKIAKYGDI